MSSLWVNARFVKRALPQWTAVRPLVEAIAADGGAERFSVQLDTDRGPKDLPEAPFALASVEAMIRGKGRIGLLDVRFAEGGFLMTSENSLRGELSIEGPGLVAWLVGVFSALALEGGVAHPASPAGFYKTKPVIAEPYWLMAFGPEQVAAIGKERIASAPAYRVELLKTGGAIVVATEDPTALGDALERVWAHLQPGAPVMSMPLDDAPDGDTDDPDAEAQRYDHEAESYIAGYHGDIPALIPATRASLEAIDRYFAERDVWGHAGVERVRELLVPAIGGYLGRLLVNELDGQWVPRRDPLEAYVAVDDRAWFVFRFVHAYLASPAAARAHSLAAYFDSAEGSE
ncbi:MAG TPA: hypothetical protein VGM88_23515 [Kofleriaceae bacterium]|jgi:hypothetical protein